MPTPQPETAETGRTSQPCPQAQGKDGSIEGKNGELKNDPSTGELESGAQKAAKPAKTSILDAFWEQATSTSTQVVTPRM
jgi:hypothetical protein